MGHCTCCLDWPVPSLLIAALSVVTAAADTINTYINSGLSGSTEEDNTSFRELHWPQESMSKTKGYCNRLRSSFSRYCLDPWGRKLSYEWRLRFNIHRQPLTLSYMPQSESPVTLQVLEMRDLCGQAAVWIPTGLSYSNSTQRTLSINNLLLIDFQCGGKNVPDPPQGDWRCIWSSLFVVRVVTARAHMLWWKDPSLRRFAGPFVKSRDLKRFDAQRSRPVVRDTSLA